jgi:hypothetical protein
MGRRVLQLALYPPHWVDGPAIVVDAVEQPSPGHVLSGQVHYVPCLACRVKGVSVAAFACHRPYVELRARRL